MISILRATGSKVVRERFARYVGGCPPPPPPPSQGRCGGSAKPGTLCPRPAPDVPPNPCAPREEGGHAGSYKKYQYILFFVMFPLIAIQSLRAFSHDELAEEECRDYEYMRIRTKRFPWGDGVKSLFHNPHVNRLPGECSRERADPDAECDD